MSESNLISQVPLISENEQFKSYDPKKNYRTELVEFSHKHLRLNPTISF